MEGSKGGVRLSGREAAGSVNDAMKGRGPHIVTAVEMRTSEQENTISLDSRVSHHSPVPSSSSYHLLPH